jgi:hypothetical protein
MGGGMTIARIAYLTTPSPGVFVLNLQPEGEEGILRFEISKAHLCNIIIDGTSLALREAFVHHRVQSLQTESAEHERTGT